MRAHCKSKSDEQRATCGCRKKKQAVANTGPKPSRAATFAPKEKCILRRINMKMQPYIGSYIKGDLGGVKVSNPSLRAYYGG